MEILLTIIILLLASILYYLYTEHKLKNTNTSIKEVDVGCKRYDKYDIDAFHKRMTDLRNTEYTDEEIVDGVKLFQVTDTGPQDYNDSGVEVITDAMEMSLDKRISKK